MWLIRVLFGSPVNAIEEAEEVTYSMKQRSYWDVTNAPLILNFHTWEKIKLIETSQLPFLRYRNFWKLIPSQTFSLPDAKLCNIMWQIYTTLCYIAAFSPPYCRERPFLRRRVGDNVTKRAKNGENVAQRGEKVWLGISASVYVFVPPMIRGYH